MYALERTDPPCSGCHSGDVALDEANTESVRVWVLLNAHARTRADLPGNPGSLRLEAMRAECDRTADPVGLFEKILILEQVLNQPQKE